MKRVVFFILLLCVICIVPAQYKFSSYNAHASLLESVQTSSEIIKGRTVFFEKKANDKPLMFQKTKVRVAELNRLSNNLSKYIIKLQNTINTENILYDLLDREAYKNTLFKSNGKLSFKGISLKSKIDSLYNCAVKINVHRLSQLENFYEDHFKTNREFYDFNQNKISFFDRLFYDKSNYGIMMSMNYLLLDVKTFQLLYYGTIMKY